MKKLLKSNIIVMLALALLTISCNKDKDDVGGIDAGSGKLTAKIDGQNWESKDEVNGAVILSQSGTNTITAYHEDGSYIGLTLFGSTFSSGQTIETSGGIFQANYKPDFNGTESYSAVGGLGSGSITITSFSESNMKATFQFTGVKSNADGTTSEKIISSGSLDIDR